MFFTMTLGILPWDSIYSLPVNYYDFDKQDTKVYKDSDDVVFAQTFSVQNTNMTAVPRYITHYTSFSDQFFTPIRLHRGDRLILVMLFGSQDKYFAGFNFNGIFNWA